HDAVPPDTIDPFESGQQRGAGEVAGADHAHADSWNGTACGPFRACEADRSRGRHARLGVAEEDSQACLGVLSVEQFVSLARPRANAAALATGALSCAAAAIRTASTPRCRVCSAIVRASDSGSEPTWRQPSSAASALRCDAGSSPNTRQPATVSSWAAIWPIS